MQQLAPTVVYLLTYLADFYEILFNLLNKLYEEREEIVKH